MLKRCYENSLQEAVGCGCRSIAFCCISTGVYRYPLEPATRIALSAVRDWLHARQSDMLVRFCCYSDREYDCYQRVADELRIFG